MNSLDHLPEITRRILGISSPQKIILFGSYARGDYHEGSDLDVMIVLDTYKSYWDELVRSAELASDLSLEYDVTVSRTIMTEEQWKKGDLPVLVNVRAEGVLARKIPPVNYLPARRMLSKRLIFC